MGDSRNGLRLEGRRVLITGGASGLGLAAAEMFSAEGAKIALLDRDGPAVRAEAERLGAQGIVADITDEHAVAEAIEKAAEALGGLDGLVNSAGIMCADRLADTSLETWQRVLAVNLTGTFLVCRAALPFLQHHQGATVVTIASAQALLPGMSGSAYAASKAGVMIFTKSIAMEYAPNIRANVICPGAATTPMANATLASLDDEARAAFARRYAIGRLSRPDEVAEAMLFLTSSASSSITGIALAVDGGRTYH